jgi:hypothetical protein
VVTLQPLAVRADAAAVLPSVTAGSAANAMSAELVHAHANKVTTPTTRAFISSRPGAQANPSFHMKSLRTMAERGFHRTQDWNLALPQCGWFAASSNNPTPYPLPRNPSASQRYRTAAGWRYHSAMPKYKSAAFFSSGKRKFCDLNHSLKAGCGPYDSEIQSMEAAMTTAITSRVAIQARIVEWQRTFRNSDHGSSDFIPGSPRSRADWMRWFRAA